MVRWEYAAWQRWESTGPGSEEDGMNNKQRMTTLTAISACLGLALVSGAALGQNSPQVMPPAQPEPQPAAQEEESGVPGFELAANVVDFGVILDTEPAKGVIRFKNAGSGVLKVPQPRTTCGCVAATMEKHEFEPGEWCELEITFDPAGKTPGRHEQSVTFATNDPEKPSVAVKVRAFVKPLVSIEPKQVNLGTVAKHTRKETLISLTGSTSSFEAFYVTKVGEGAEFFDIEILGTDTVEQEGEMVSRTDILVTLKEDAPPGRAQAMATIRTNDDRRKIITVPLAGVIEGDVFINPVRMSLGTMSVGSQLEEVIEVRHGRNETFKITGVELRPLQPSGMAPMPIEYTVEPIDAEAGNGGKAVDAYRLKLIMPGLEEAGRIRGNFVVHTTVPMEELVMLPYVGRVVDNRAGSGE